MQKKVALCEYRPIGDGLCQCLYCPNKARSNSCRVVSKCLSEIRQAKFQASLQEEPSIATKATNFTKAVVKHVRKGAKRCTEEQIAARLEICQNCPDEKYDNAKEMCLVCGCNVNSKNKFANKLAWSEQECPLKHWLAIETKEGDKE